MSRLMITGTSSGCGKTTVTRALLAALKAREITPSAFKCGPDYIDPMFHRTVSDISACNLDPFFLDGDGLRSHLAGRAGAFSVIEGAMGYYDGVAATDRASAYTVARETETPVILVVGADGADSSLGAVIEGFAGHRPDSRISGVIFNGASEKRWPDLRRIALDAGARAYGYLPRESGLSVPGRHLGLLTPGETENFRDVTLLLGRQAERSLDIDGLLELAGTAPALRAAPKPTRVRKDSIRLAIARDRAFCFHYQENLDLLRELGCELVFFSPVNDTEPPPNVSGLYLGGGYPELYARELSENTAMTAGVRKAADDGMPIIAEGGGFLYLHQTLDCVPMCGVVQGAAFETGSLRRFGYITLTAERDSLLCRAGDSIRSHEFHYWDSSCPGDGFTARKAGREMSYPCVHASDSMYAGFPHLYFPANPAFAERFAERMAQYGG